MQVTATPFMSTTPRFVSDDASIAPDDTQASRRRRRRPSPDGWSPGGFGQQRPGANLPPNHPMHPNNRRAAAITGAEQGTASLVEDHTAGRRRRGPGNPWPIPASQRPGANLPPNHPMHPNNRR